MVLTLFCAAPWTNNSSGSVVLHAATDVHSDVHVTAGLTPMLVVCDLPIRYLTCTGAYRTGTVCSVTAEPTHLKPLRLGH